VFLLWSTIDADLSIGEMMKAEMMGAICSGDTVGSVVVEKKRVPFRWCLPHAFRHHHHSMSP
jgi:hypothetical protein